MLISPTNGAERKTTFICILLAVITVVAYSGVFSSRFVQYDDNYYIMENPHVQAGLTIDGLRWGLTARAVKNWHPLTWYSHMLDCTLFGLNPAGPHAVNLILHTANAILLLLLMRRWTGALWRSAFVAALFALHPLHVESVAWVAERKDVLSTFFMLLTLFAYTRYVQSSPNSVESRVSRFESGQEQLKEQSNGPRPSALDPRSSTHFGLWPRYALVLLLFALALMAKPMAVTLPCVMLLLDFWPLNRMPDHQLEMRRWTPLILEKLPMFAMSVICCALTLWAQPTASTVQLPIEWRVLNALLSYGRYLILVVWPANLHINYPYPSGWPIWYPLVSAVFVLIVSVVALRSARRRPYFLTGWFWFLGMLVPVIGLVQVGLQSMADRYTYMPLVGIFIVASWGGYELVRASRIRATAAATAATLAVAACVPLTMRQVGYWHDSFALFEHALRLNPRDFISENTLGVAYILDGKLEVALQHFKRAAEINPYYPRTFANIGRVDLWLERYADAAEAYGTAARLSPNFAEAQYGLGYALKQIGNNADAEEPLASAVRLDPNFWNSRDEYGQVLLVKGKAEEALEQFDQAARLNPGNPEIHLHRADALSSLHRPTEAVAEYQEALKINPNMIQALNNLAWLLATEPDAANRDGSQAVRLAERACELTGNQGPMLLGTLAAAYAEAGRFAEATATATKAADLAASTGKDQVAAQNRKLAELYKSNKAYHRE